MDPTRFPMNAFAGAQSEIITIPDRMVGLIIGKGGEQISAIQTESDCKVQFAPDSTSMAERPCTLTGSPESIQKAKELINRIMHKGHDMPGSGGGMGFMQGGDMMNDGQQTMIEMMIPGNKAGIIIGKGGDTIKQLQERASVRMIIIQDSNTPTNYDKPLRITGDRINCNRARELVLELLAEKDNMMLGGGGGGGSAGGYGDYGARNSMDLPVPRSLIGIVIGKGGEMIKKIQQDSGARIQFKPEDESGGPNRMCSVMGSQEQTASASNMILELIDNAMQRQGVGGGDIGGWGQLQQRGSREQLGGSSRPRFGNGGVSDEITYSVPADKCGLVIGKGGETIREICRQSGAHVELNRDQSASISERVFRVQGSADQIRQAVALINEKAGVPASRDGNGIGGMGMMSSQSMGNVYGSPGSQTPQQQQQPMQHFALQQSQQQQQPQYQYQQYNTPTVAADLPKQQQVSDTNAAWAAYYAALYQQQQQQLAQQQQQTTAVVQQQQPSPYGAILPRSTVTPQPSLSAIQQQQPQQTTAPDYTAAWAEYYRQLGLHQQAQAVMLQSAGVHQQQPQ